MRVPEAAAIDVALVEKFGLPKFVELAWDIVEPSQPFIGGWHIDEICYHLTAVSAGDIRNLLINIPPGMSKSLLACVFWGVHDWIQNTDRKWMFGSFDGGLTIRDSRRALGLVESEWFQARWPHVRKNSGQDVPGTVTEWHIHGGGWRFATSTGGKATGHHPNIKVIDDPTKPKDAMISRDAMSTALENAIDWYTGTLASRQADPKTTATVIIMQRLHERDLSGYVLEEEQGKYIHLKLPMEYEPKNRCVTRWFRGVGNERQEITGGDRRTEDGELLCPERFDRESVRDLRRTMGSDVSSGQLDQRPNKAGGSIFREEWFRYWGVEGLYETLPSRMYLIQVWDFAFKGKPTRGSKKRSFVAGQLWGRSGADCFLLDQERGMWGFVDSIKAVKRLTLRWPKATRKLFEDAANGPAIRDALRGKMHGIVMVPTGGGSIARAEAMSPMFEASNIWIPHPSKHEWVTDYKTELTAFPNGKNDDQVDCTTHALVDLSSSIVSTYKEAMARLGS